MSTEIIHALLLKITRWQAAFMDQQQMVPPFYGKHHLNDDIHVEEDSLSMR